MTFYRLFHFIPAYVLVTRQYGQFLMKLIFLFSRVFFFFIFFANSKVFCPSLVPFFDFQGTHVDIPGSLLSSNYIALRLLK